MWLYFYIILVISGLLQQLRDKESICNARDVGDMGLNPGSGISSGGYVYIYTFLPPEENLYICKKYIIYLKEK